MLRHVLESVGLRVDDERVYRVLLEHPGSTAEELAGLTGMGLPATRSSLARLDDSGLVSRSTDPNAYTATPPVTALEVLVRRREEELGGVRLVAEELQEVYRQATQSGRQVPDLIDVAVGRPAVMQRFEQLQRGAKQTIWAMMRPPWAARKTNPTESETLGRGIVARGLYDSSALEEPGELDHVQWAIQQGEQVRILRDVPVKLVGADTDMAILRVGHDDPDMAEGALIVYSSPLLDALIALFESLWERAAPFGLQPPVGKTAGAPELSEDVLAVLALQADGLTDQAICRRLGISRATLSRRTQRAMQALGAKTRLHAGALAIRRGILT